MKCEEPFTRGERKGQPRTGTTNGYRAHRAAGEPACRACLDAEVEAARSRKQRAAHLTPQQREERREQSARAQRRKKLAEERLAAAKERAAEMDAKTDWESLARKRAGEGI